MHQAKTNSLRLRSSRASNMCENKKRICNQFTASVRESGISRPSDRAANYPDNTHHQLALPHFCLVDLQMKKTRTTRLPAAFLPWVCMFSLLVYAVVCTANQDGIKADIRSVIELQLDAFARGDATTAYAQASPTIQTLFPTEETFMMMVRSGYAALIAPRRVEFLELFYDQASPVYRVGIESPDGTRWMAFYRMTAQPDRSWRIAGCFLTIISGQLI